MMGFVFQMMNSMQKVKLNGQPLHALVRVL